jgi:hypothetical protein
MLSSRTTVTRSILFILAMVAMIGCRRNNAFNYSERIVKMEVDLSKKIAVADEKVTRYIDAGHHDSARIISNNMEQLAAQAWEDVKQLKAPDVAEADHFKREAVKYFGYLHTIYAAFHKFVEAPEGAQKETERNNLMKIVKEKDAATRKLQAAQEQFAAANNFRIGKKE